MVRSNEDSARICPSIRRAGICVNRRNLRTEKRSHQRGMSPPHALADHSGGVDPATLSGVQAHEYFVPLIRDKELRPSSIRPARAAIELFSTRVTGLNWGVFASTRTREAMPLPAVVSCAELPALFLANRTELRGIGRSVCGICGK